MLRETGSDERSLPRVVLCSLSLCLCHRRDERPGFSKKLPEPRGESKEYVSTDEAICTIIKNSTYRVEHFYTLGFLEGGVTRSQFETLYATFAKLRNDDLEIEAAMHGIDVSKEAESKDPQITTSQNMNKEVPLFGNPDEYANMSSEEKEELTHKMMGKHKKWQSEQRK